MTCNFTIPFILQMSHEDVNPIYPHTKEEKQEIRRELGLKDSTIEEDIDAIIDWFQKQPHLVEAGIGRYIFLKGYGNSFVCKGIFVCSL